MSGPNFPYSRLDVANIVRRVFEESNDRLRVDAAVTVVLGEVEVIIDEADDSIQIFGNDGTTNRAIKTNAAGELQVDVLASALPTGAATSANQTNGSQLSRITDGTDTAQVTAAGELNVFSTARPGVDIGDVTINNAAGVAAVNIQDGGNSITVDGTVTVVQPTGTNLHAVIDSGTITTITNVVHVDDNAGSLTVDGTVSAVQSGTWNVNNVSGTISLPTGAATSVNQTNGSQKSQIVDGSGNVIAAINNTLNVNETPNTSFLQLLLTLTTTPVVAKVGGSNLSGRKYLIIWNTSGTNIYYGTSAVNSTNGFRISNNSSITIPVGPSIDVYIVKQSGSGDVVIQEFA